MYLNTGEVFKFLFADAIVKGKVGRRTSFEVSESKNYQGNFFEQFQCEINIFDNSFYFQ